MSLDLPAGSEQQWGALVYASGDHDYFKEQYGGPTRENVIQFLTFDRDYGESILSCVIAAGKMPVVSDDDCLGDVGASQSLLFRGTTTPRNAALWNRRTIFSNTLRMSSHLFVGTTVTTMFRRAKAGTLPDWDEFWNELTRLRESLM